MQCLEVAQSWANTDRQHRMNGSPKGVLPIYSHAWRVAHEPALDLELSGIESLPHVEFECCKACSVRLRGAWQPVVDMHKFTYSLLTLMSTALVVTAIQPFAGPPEAAKVTFKFELQLTWLVLATGHFLVVSSYWPGPAIAVCFINEPVIKHCSNVTFLLLFAHKWGGTMTSVRMQSLQVIKAISPYQ